jgi:hypothetical protein
VLKISTATNQVQFTLIPITSGLISLYRVGIKIISQSVILSLDKITGRDKLFLKEQRLLNCNVVFYQLIWNIALPCCP